jgi:Domain of unknown function (DUF4136)
VRTEGWTLVSRGAAGVVVALVAWAAGGGLEAAKTEIKVGYDKKFSFAGLKTWAWHPEGKGDVMLAVTAEDDPKKVAARVDPIIIPSVEREMTARGYTAAASGADLFVRYYVLASVKTAAQVAGQFLPVVPEWGIPPFTPQTTALSIYPAGSLVIDVTSTAAKAIVWRGIAERKIDLEKPDEERRKVLEDAIRDLLAKLPRKK